MGKNSNFVLREASASSFILTLTILLTLVLGLVCFKGQSVEIYVLSFLLGCLPITVVGLFKPIFNPYVNFWTRRTENDLSAEERSSLQVLIGPKGKKAIILSMVAVGILTVSLYVVINYLLKIEPHVVEGSSSYETVALGSFFTFWLTLGYQIFFLSRTLRGQKLR